MMLITRCFIASLGFTLATAVWATTPIDELLSEYRQQGASNFSAAAGKKLWNQTMRPYGTNSDRSCASCHTHDLRQNGRHAVTGKLIKPLAPSVMSKRLTNLIKVRKWLKRNCLWTRGRECTPQEKGDLLVYLKDL